MISNTPLEPLAKALKRKLWRDYPEDLRPSRLARWLAHFGTVHGVRPAADPARSPGRRRVGTIAVAGMIIFHLHITSTFPLAVPLEWNIFMIFGTALPLRPLRRRAALDPRRPAADRDARGHLRRPAGARQLPPRQVSFLPSMRYYAGNWATSQWLFRKDSGAEDEARRADRQAGADRRRAAGRDLRPRDWPTVLLNKGLAFRSMHSHGRALNGLLPRAVDDVEAYDVREGELIAGVVNGWNFGDGHFHDQPAAGGGAGALRVRAGRGAGGRRSSPQPAGSGRQRYRIYDAADRAGRGGLGRRRRHGRAPALARRVGSSRSR